MVKKDKNHRKGLSENWQPSLTKGLRLKLKHLNVGYMPIWKIMHGSSIIGRQNPNPSRSRDLKSQKMNGILFFAAVGTYLSE